MFVFVGGVRPRREMQIYNCMSLLSLLYIGDGFIWVVETWNNEQPRNAGLDVLLITLVAPEQRLREVDELLRTTSEKWTICSKSSAK